MEGMGKEKLQFSLLKLAKCQKGPLRKSVTNFVTNVANSQVHQKIPFVNLKTHLLILRGRHLFIKLHFRSIMRPLKQNPE